MPRENALATPGSQVFVAVLGLTGSGKSSFINQCIGYEVADAGNSLSSMTQKPQVYSTEPYGVTINLIDTPGFENTT